jgi:hypothetical protein
VNRRALALGLAAAIVYVAGAAVSGHLSIFARRPILDGTGPPVPYAWVSPPPELVFTNKPPASGNFTVTIGTKGSKPDTLSTADAQLTLIVPAGAFAPTSGARAIGVKVEPLDPASIARIPGPETPQGNLYRITATYLPSNAPVRNFAKPLEAVVEYPVTPNVHTTSHLLEYAADGKSWSKVASADSTAFQQVQAPVAGPGYVIVAANVSALPSTLPPVSSGGGSRRIVALIVIAVCLAIIVAALVLRGREDTDRGR